MNIRYLVKCANELDYNEVDYFEYETEKQALEKVNKLMIATNDDTTKWQDGQEKEFLALCAEHPHNWGEVALIDLQNCDDVLEAEQAETGIILTRDDD
jgi:hypothetical protein